MKRTLLLLCALAPALLLAGCADELSNVTNTPATEQAASTSGDETPAPEESTPAPQGTATAQAAPAVEEKNVGTLVRIQVLPLSQLLLSQVETTDGFYVVQGAVSGTKGETMTLGNDGYLYFSEEKLGYAIYSTN